MSAEATADGGGGVSPLLAVRDLASAYAGGVEVLHGVSFDVAPSEVLAIVGANGAGKTTLARALANLLPCLRGEVTKGQILFDGRDARRMSPAALVRAGLASVLEGRHCFPALTIEENLALGGIARGTGRRELRRDLDQIYAIFPDLVSKRHLAAAQVSGGQQQMTAIGRALMSRPRLLVVDEASMGLAPMTVQKIFEALLRLRGERGLSLVFIDQNLRLAKRYADDLIVMVNGRVRDVAASDRVRVEDIYFGAA